MKAKANEKKVFLNLYISQAVFFVDMGEIMCTNLKDSDPVFWMWGDERGECVMTFKRCLREEAFPNILEDDMGEVGRLHDNTSSSTCRCSHIRGQ